ncbi:phospholipid carrier-dependent glycosyltransferase [Streptosporangiaceae bacterium NEAU-GS5]|nr:phospholipid carrier-dependent glycosyltransferase [Streptosporangiaceae bacterium NEAU-GS5]
MRFVNLRPRLVPPLPANALWGWAGPLAVTLFAAFLRLVQLSQPHAVVFDEEWYAKDAWSLLKFGVERDFVEDAKQRLISGNLDLFKPCCGEFVVHPPLGKWMIAFGELIFGPNPFGWRIVAAITGTLTVLVLARTARRMTRSTLLGCLAGLLLAVDALHVVLSRTALLDVFLAFWVVAGFACLVVDRDWARTRLEAATDAGIRLGWRPWRLGAGLCLGAATAVKWSGIFFVVAFAILSLLWDAGARRRLGLRTPYVTTLRLDAPLAAAWAIIVPLAVYLVSWTGWFLTDKGWGRNWEQATSAGPVYFVIDSVRSWLSYQVEMLHSSTSLNAHHAYQSQPWTWPFLLRPVAFFYDSPTGCGAAQCTRAIIGAGSPVIWFGALLAIIGVITWYTGSRDWRGGTVLLGYAVGWVPWFYFALADHRTMFLFYMAPVLPFMILAITLVSGLLIGGPEARRRPVGTAVVGAFALLAIANFWWLQPILMADVVTYAEWHRRLLFPSWL